MFLQGRANLNDNAFRNLSKYTWLNQSDVFTGEIEQAVYSDYIEKNGITDIKAHLQPYVDAYNRTAVPYKKIGILKIRTEEFPKNTLRKILRFKLDTTID